MLPPNAAIVPDSLNILLVSATTKEMVYAAQQGPISMCFHNKALRLLISLVWGYMYKTPLKGLVTYLMMVVAMAGNVDAFCGRNNTADKLTKMF